MPSIVIGRDDDDMKKYGEAGTIMIGKHLVGTGEDTHMTTPVLMDVLRPHVLCITGKRGSGKSFSLGIIAEEITKLPDKVKKNLCSVVIDTQGIFWTMKSPNEKEMNLLSTWNLKPSSFNVNVIIPIGQEKIFSHSDVDYDETFSVAPSELNTGDWLNVFDLKANEPLGILLQQTLGKMKGNYDIEKIIEQISIQQGFDKERMALKNYFEAAKTWGIFGESRMPDILVGGKTTIVDVSLTPQNVRTLLVSMLAKKVLDERITARRKEELAEIEGMPIQRTPMCWFMIDEAHNFIPAAETTASTEVLNKIVKEGRQPGITLVLVTQRPEKLHPDALSQCDLIISYRLTAEADVKSLESIMQTYLLFNIGKYLNELPNLKGSAIILDDNSERMYKVRIRPRQSWHAGSSPVAI